MGTISLWVSATGRHSVGLQVQSADAAAAEISMRMSAGDTALGLWRGSWARSNEGDVTNKMRRSHDVKVTKPAALHGTL